MSYYNASPHHRYRHRLSLRLLLRLQVSKQDFSTENIHWEHSRLMERASKLQEWRAQHEATPDTQEETREDNITTIII